MCRDIMEYADDKNPNDIYGLTPLHQAAENGHLSICQLIVENVDDKNRLACHFQPILKKGPISFFLRLYHEFVNHTYLINSKRQHRKNNTAKAKNNRMLCSLAQSKAKNNRMLSSLAQSKC